MLRFSAGLVSQLVDSLEAQELFFGVGPLGLEERFDLADGRDVLRDEGLQLGRDLHGSRLEFGDEGEDFAGLRVDVQTRKLLEDLRFLRREGDELLMRLDRQLGVLQGVLLEEPG